jgi:hypothetical protein
MQIPRGGNAAGSTNLIVRGNIVILLPLKLKYRQGGFDNGNHGGKHTGNNTKKRIWKKHQPHPDIRGSRVKSFC